MSPHIKILHIDADYHVFLMVIDKGDSRLSNLSLQEALDLIKTQEINLILSEPQNMAIFNKSIPSVLTIN